MPSYRSTAFDRWVASFRFRAAMRHIEPGSRVCDVGCGIDGLFLASLAHHASFRVGLDYQRVAARMPGASFVRMDITGPFPFADGCFDHVTMLAVIEHLKEPEAIMGEVFRILAPGGSVVMTWPGAAVDPLLALLSQAGIVSKEMESHKHEPRKPPAYWRGVMRGTGFVRPEHRTFELGLNHIVVARKPSAPAMAAAVRAEASLAGHG